MRATFPKAVTQRQHENDGVAELRSCAVRRSISNFATSVTNCKYLHRDTISHILLNIRKQKRIRHQSGCSSLIDAIPRSFADYQNGNHQWSICSRLRYIYSMRKNEKKNLLGNASSLGLSTGRDRSPLQPNAERYILLIADGENLDS